MAKETKLNSDMSLDINEMSSQAPLNAAVCLVSVLLLTRAFFSAFQLLTYRSR